MLLQQEERNERNDHDRGESSQDGGELQPYAFASINPKVNANKRLPT